MVLIFHGILSFYIIQKFTCQISPGLTQPFNHAVITIEMTYGYARKKELESTFIEIINSNGKSVIVVGLSMNFFWVGCIIFVIL